MRRQYDRRDLGATSTTANPVLVSDYTYNPWTADGGRMSDLQAGIYTDQDSLLDLRYDYDQVGNLRSILDVTNNSQKQCFNYDALNRLIKAAVGANNDTCTGSVGNGEYADQTYGYDPSTGNLLNKTGVGTYTYLTGKHRVTSAGSLFTLIYDANGNMTTRTVSGSTYTLGYDAENRLTSVSGAATAAFTYDGDGNRVKSVVGSTTTLFVGSHYESSGGVITKYYLAGGTRLAMRKGSTSFYWLLSDHLGSTSKVATAAGALHSQQLYKAWGESRYTSGTLPTRYTYTGQYSYAGDFGLVFYGSRFYDPLLARWASPDSIIPQNQGTLAWDRYSYVNNSPLNYTDPTGHMVDDGCDTEGCSGDPDVVVINPPPKNPPQQSISNVPQTQQTPITNIIKLLPGSSEDWAMAGTVTDGVVLLLDLYADGVVAYATIAGFGSTLPVVVTGNIEVPAMSGGAAFLVADFFLVKPILTLGNYGASAATVMTFVSETKSGATVIEIGQISAATKNSAILTLAGWVAPEAICSTLIQGASLANDLGWISFPNH